MTKKDLIINISKSTGFTRGTCESIIDSFIDEIKKGLMSGDNVIITNFMGLEVNTRPQRLGRNPKTGEVTTFPAVKTIKCKICPSIKDAINER